MMSYRCAQSDPDVENYNLSVYNKYLKTMEVDQRTAAYKSVKNVDDDFVSTDEIRTMLRQKYRHRGVSQKSEEDIERMVTAATNIIDKTPNPIGNINTFNNSMVLDHISTFNENFNNNQINEMQIENETTDNIVDDIVEYNISSSSST
jgi:hypothetical protein